MMKKHRRSLAAAGAALVLSLGLGMTPAHAAIINGSFESGDFSGFSTTGDTSIQTSAFGVVPTDGTFQALATNSFPGSVPATNLETFFGLAPGSLNTLAQPSSNPVATEGSGFLQSFTGLAGETFSFEFNFLTNEGGTEYVQRLRFLRAQRNRFQAGRYQLDVNPS